MCYDIIDEIYDNYYAYLACRRHEEHALIIRERRVGKKKKSSY